MGAGAKLTPCAHAAAALQVPRSAAAAAVQPADRGHNGAVRGGPEEGEKRGAAEGCQPVLNSA